MDSNDLTKVRGWFDAEGEEPSDGWPFPAPPYYTKSTVTGQLRLDILARIGKPAGDMAEVYLIEGEYEGGYSEWTIEWNYDIEVWITEKGSTQPQRVWSADSDEHVYVSPSSLPQFLAWLGQA